MQNRGRTVAIVALVLAAAGLLLVLSAGPGARFGLWNYRTGLGLLRYCLYLGGAGALLGIVGLAMGGARPLAALAILLALPAIATPLQFRRTAQSLPFIHDISTDTQDPPAFVAVLPLRKDASNPPEYAGAEAAQQQKAAYPAVQPARLAEPPAQAFARAREAAEAMGWEIVAADAAAGRIEATDTTFWFGFKDDVVIRVRPDGTGSRVDVRSKSRVGKSDVGANARRIERYLQRLRPPT